MTTECAVNEINSAYAEKNYGEFIARMAAYYCLDMVSDTVESALREYHKEIITGAPILSVAMDTEENMLAAPQDYLSGIKDKVLPFTVGRGDDDPLALALVNFPNFIEQLEAYVEGERYYLEFSPLEFPREQFTVCFFKDQAQAAQFLYDQHTDKWPSLHAQQPRKPLGRRETSGRSSV